MKYITKFINSIYFIILVNIITVIFWYFKLPIVTYLIYLCFCILILISNANRTAIASLILSAIIAYQVDDANYLDFHKFYAKIFIPLGLIVIALFTFDLIKKRKEFKLSSIFYAFLFLLIANILSLVNVIGKDRELFIVSILGVLQLIGYLIIYIYLFNTKSNESKTYISYVCLITATAVTMQLFIHYLTLGKVSGKGDNNLSWAVSNTIAMFYCALIPVGLYNYFQKQKQNFWTALISGINLCMMLFMLSRGAYVAFATILIPAIFVIIYITKDKKRLIIDFLTIFIICFVISLYVGGKLGIVEMIKNYFKDIDFLDGSGREDLYKIGFNLFKKYPLFGAGSYSGAFYLKEKKLGTYHNFIIQALATTGIVGLISLGYFIYVVIKTSLIKNKYNLLILISFIYLIIHGLVDNTFYNPIIMLFFVTTLPYLELKKKKTNLMRE